LLKVFDRIKKSVGAFHDYERLLRFITSLENQKLLENTPTFGQGNWSFAEYNSEDLKKACAWIKPEFLTTVQLKALEQNFGLLELCRGDFTVLQEIIITPELDVECFKRKFCLDYCLSQDWLLIETQAYKPSLSALTGENGYAVHPYTRKNRLSLKDSGDKHAQRLNAELNCRINRLRQYPVENEGGRNSLKDPSHYRKEGA
jgi:hypothetical protein